MSATRLFLQCRLLPRDLHRGQAADGMHRLVLTIDMPGSTILNRVPRTWEYLEVLRLHLLGFPNAEGVVIGAAAARH